MADAWDQFPDAPAGADPWEQFPDAQRKRVTRQELMRQNPAEYDPQSPEYRDKYGTGGVGAVLKDVGRNFLRAPATAADTALSIGRSAVAAPVAGVVGAVTAPAGFIPGMEGVGARNVERVQNFIGGQPFTERGQQVMDAAAYIPGKVEQVTDWVGQKAANATNSPLVGAGVKTALSAAPAVLTRGKLGRGNSAPNNPARPVGAGKTQARPEAPAKAERVGGLERVPDKAPSLEKLQADKDAAYKRAEETGVVVSREALNRLKVQIVNDLKKEGLDKDLHPKTSAALKRVLETKGQPSLSELETLRKIANDAKGAIDKSDGRLGARIVDKIDEFEDTLGDADVISGNPAAATAYKEARALNTRLSKARDIGELFERAEVKAGANYTQSGMENALRQEFKALALNKNKMRRFSPEERAAIKRVAMGGKAENALRMLGKLAPTGVVPWGLGSLTGFAVGGAPGAALVPAVGAASKYAATKMTLRNAKNAEELMRRGPGNALSKSRNALATAQ